MTSQLLDPIQPQECRVIPGHPHSLPFTVLPPAGCHHELAATTVSWGVLLPEKPMPRSQSWNIPPSASGLALSPPNSRSSKPPVLSYLGLPVDSPPWTYTFENTRAYWLAPGTKESTDSHDSKPHVGPWEEEDTWSLGRGGKKDLGCFIMNPKPGNQPSWFWMHSATLNF